MWQNWTNVVLGLCIIAAVFVGVTGATLMWTFGVLGFLVTALGFWGAMDDMGNTTVRHA